MILGPKSSAGTLHSDPAPTATMAAALDATAALRQAAASARGSAQHSEAMPLSVRAAFAGSVVVLTGATGYIGQLLLERMLPLRPAAVFCIIRASRGASAADRLTKVLEEGSAFAKLREDAGRWAELTPIARAVEADLTWEADKLQAALAASLSTLPSPRVDFLVACAAGRSGAPRVERPGR
jgi:hypothetical protein